LYSQSRYLFTHSGIVGRMQLGAGDSESRPDGGQDGRCVITHFAVIKEHILKQKIK